MTTSSATPPPKVDRSNATFVFVADHGQLKTYLLDRAHSAQLRLVNALEFPEIRRPVSTELSGPAGGFPNLGSNGQGNATGERSGIAREQENRAIRTMAEKILATLTQVRPRAWHLVAPADVDSRLIEQLPAEARALLTRRVSKNLVNVPPNLLLRHLV